MAAACASICQVPVLNKSTERKIYCALKNTKIGKKIQKNMDLARSQRGEIGQLPPRNFDKRMYLLGAATRYIILPPPENISWLRPWYGQ